MIMNPEVKAMWLTDLRSGEFTQGKGALRTEDGEYCCLGVLCELGAREGIIPPAELRGANDEGECRGYWYGTGDKATTAVLPQAVQDWAGLVLPNPQIPAPPEFSGDCDYEECEESPDHKRVVGLADLNDDDLDRFPFPKIADLIDAHL
jgi:hypothetical protein